MSSFSSNVNHFAFGLYPYLCLAVFFVGSLLRYERDQYTWKSDSSQLLKRGQLRWGSRLFHIGILLIFFGHLFGLLTPHALYESFLTASHKQLLAMTTGGVAGLFCFIGVSLLLHRRLAEPRLRHNSKTSDIMLLFIFWLQLVLGLGSIFVSAEHPDGSVMLRLSSWAQHIVTFQGGAAELMQNISWVFRLHMLLGMTISLIFPFTRLVHVWSGFSSVLYLLRPYQLVRSRRLSARTTRR